MLSHHVRRSRKNVAKRKEKEKGLRKQLTLVGLVCHNTCGA
jgi:hypothetical protein